VLLQGGNYEPDDRKGWDEGIQAFAAFLAKYPRAHLYLHAVSSRSIIKQEVGKEPAPQSVDSGVPLLTILHVLGVPHDSYTLDMRIHPRPRVLELKQLADVCLHPSKVEGFGMNVLECQALGTPVITTEYLAMGDYTKFGIAVPPRQLEFMFNGMMAQPDVKGVTAALHTVAGGGAIGSAEEAGRWIADTFSSELIGRKFDELLQRVGGKGKGDTGRDGSVGSAVDLGTCQAEGCRELESKLYTVVTGMYTQPQRIATPWVILADADVKLSSQELAKFVEHFQPDVDGALVALVPTAWADGVAVPLLHEGTAHPDLVVMMRSHLFVKDKTLHRHGISGIVCLHVSGAIKRLPEGLAQFRTKSVSTLELE